MEQLRNELHSSKNQSSENHLIEIAADPIQQ